jgi:hypothetical protein
VAWENAVGRLERGLTPPLPLRLWTQIRSDDDRTEPLSAAQSERRANRCSEWTLDTQGFRAGSLGVETGWPADHPRLALEDLDIGAGVVVEASRRQRERLPQSLGASAPSLGRDDPQ